MLEIKIVVLPVPALPFINNFPYALLFFIN